MKNLFSLASMLVLSMMLSSCATVTPLGNAAKRGDVKQVQALLSNGANVNEVRTPGLSPLHEAVFNNASSDIIALLIDSGADVNMKSCGDGWAASCACGTPLSIAACKGNGNMVKLLIDRGAEIDGVDNWGYTPLAQAATHGQSSIVRMLIDKGADADVARGFLISKNQIPAAQVIEIAEKGLARKKAPVQGKPEPLAAVAQSDIDEPPAVPVKQNKNAYAIVIGIEQYRQKLPKADFAAQDARLVSDYLIKAMGYPEENVITLLNDHASYVDLAKYFEKWLPNNVEKGGTVFIYFSGHGAPNPNTGVGYLVPYDGDPTFIDQTGYSLKRMYEALGKLPAKKIVVALDSCFSGAGGRSVLAEGARPLVMNLQSATTLPRNMTVIAAASGSQISSTYKDKGHGLFTYFMLKGIKNEDVINPDGSINMEDLFGYLAPQVARIARKQYNNEQTPQIIGSKTN